MGGGGYRRPAANALSTAEDIQRLGGSASEGWTTDEKRVGMRRVSPFEPVRTCRLCQSGTRKGALACIEGAKRPKCALARGMKMGCEKCKASFTSVLPEHMNTLDFDVFGMCSASCGRGGFPLCGAAKFICPFCSYTSRTAL